MKLNTQAKIMLRCIIVIFAALVIGAAIYYRSFECLPFVLGAFLGCAASVIKVIMLSKAVDKALTITEPVKAGNYIRLQHLLRLALTAAALIIAALVPFINLWGAVAGILSFSISSYGLKLFSK